MTYWALSKNEGSIALAIGLLGLAKLNRSIANCDFLLSTALLGQTKSTVGQVNTVKSGAIDTPNVLRYCKVCLWHHSLENLKPVK